jgi:DNA-binding NarL/FixJ family response regulator
LALAHCSGHVVARRVGVSVRVLLIEDDPDLRLEMREYLQRRGHEVTDCGSLGDGRAVVRQLVDKSAPPEVVVCDVNLPDGNGVDFYVTASPGLPNSQWVLVSGAHDIARVEEVGGRIGLPSCTIVDKPVSMRALSAAFVRR